MQPPFYQISSAFEYDEAFHAAETDPQGFWGAIADTFRWRQKWNDVLEWNIAEPKVKWFVNAKMNITENCIDRHLEKNGEKVAILWEPNDPTEKVRTYTYQQLQAEVNKLANV